MGKSNRQVAAVCSPYATALNAKAAILNPNTKTKNSYAIFSFKNP
jgi:hypothetical protein